MEKKAGKGKVVSVYSAYEDVPIFNKDTMAVVTHLNTYYYCALPSLQNPKLGCVKVIGWLFQALESLHDLSQGKVATNQLKIIAQIEESSGKITDHPVQPKNGIPLTKSQ